MEEGRVDGDKTEKLQQVQDSPRLKSVRAEMLLGDRLAVLALRDTLPRVSPPAALLEAEHQPGRTRLQSWHNCSDASSCCEEGNSLRYVVRYHNA